MKNIAIFASGNGSNFEAIAKAVINKEIDAKLCFLFCDKKNAFALERAKKLGIKAYQFSLKDFNSKVEYEEEIVKLLDEYKIDFVFLAGYMKICGPTLLEKYENKIINIHPALLPSFKGAHGILDAYNYGVKVFGVTLHYVDGNVDTGKIIAQGIIDYVDGDTLEVVEEKIHKLEHKLYIKTIKELVE